MGEPLSAAVTVGHVGHVHSICGQLVNGSDKGHEGWLKQEEEETDAI